MFRYKVAIYTDQTVSRGYSIIPGSTSRAKFQFPGISSRSNLPRSDSSVEMMCYGLV